MKKITSNPFAMDSSVKFGLAPGNGSVKRITGNQQNRAGIRRAPQGIGTMWNMRGRRFAGDTGIEADRTVQSGQADVGGEKAGMATAYAVDRNIDLHNETTDISGGINENTESAKQKSYKAAQTGNGSRNAGRSYMDDDAISLDFTEEDLLKGFIMSEILGRPRCFRNAR